MFNFKAKFYLKIIFILSVISLISAYFIEYILGHKPCNLCLIERIPYGLSIIFIVSIFILKNNEKFIVLLLILTSFFLLWLYQFIIYGIEQGFFQESAVCNVKNLTENITKEDLLKQLNERIVSCKDVTFRIFGLSLTSINIMISLLFIITLLKVYTIYEI